MTTKHSFPTKPTRSENQIEYDFLLLNDTKAKDPSLHFKTAITRKWKMMDLPIQSLDNENPLVTLALLRRVDNPVAEIEVIAAQIPREVDPANWLAIHLKNHGFKILQMRRLPSPTGEVGDILAEINLNAKTYVARSLAIKDGSRVFAIHCQVESNSYEKVSEEFFMAISNFNLLNPSGQKFAEPMKPYKASVPINCEFLFPVSWIEKADSNPPPKGDSVSFINLKTENWAGQFTFAVIRHQEETSYQGLYLNYLEQLDENDIDVEAQDLKLIPNVSGFNGMWTGTLSAMNDDDKPMEVRCGILEHPKAWLLFAIIGPDWESDAEAQSLNYRAFRIALETLSVG